MSSGGGTAPPPDAPPALGSLASLARKLKHPLVHIRARALANLLFKLREGLVNVASATHHDVDTLASALVICLHEPELEAQALQVFDWMLPSDNGAIVRVTAPSLQRHGATVLLQRGANSVHPTRPDLQAAYEKLLQRLLATPNGGDMHPIDPPLLLPISPPTDPPAQAIIHATPMTQHTTHAIAETRRQPVRLDPPSDPLTMDGWRPPHVALAAVDDQLLFELEVKWKRRADMRDLVTMCDTFRCELLRDFPPQVFLQRPAMLQRVLELVRQPIVPAPTDPELSFGVNYFDEPSFSKSFVWKPSIAATALHVASLKVLEAWLAAMRHGLQVALNPLYHNYPSPTSTNGSIVPTLAFDHRRLHYPRTQEDVNGRHEDAAGYSLSGAMYTLSAVLLRLAASDAYPHLHLLNLLHVALEFLPERSGQTRGEHRDVVHPLMKSRLEALLAIVVDVVSSNKLVESWKQSITHERLIDYVIGLLHLQEPAAYRVDGDGCEGDDGGEVQIPVPVWKWLLHGVVTNPSRHRAIAFLSRIDPASSTTATSIAREAHDEKVVRRALASPQASPSLAVALRVVRALPSLDEDQRAAAVQYIAHAVRDWIQHSSGHGARAGSMHAVILYCLNRVGVQASPYEREMAVKTLEAVVDAIVDEESQALSKEDRLDVVVAAVTESGDIMQALLAALASTATASTELLWHLAEILLNALVDSSRLARVHTALGSSLALLQHFAYADPAVFSMTEAHRRLQRSFVRLTHQLETSLPATERWLLVSRCLLHKSAYIRKAAASGLFEMVRGDVKEEDDSAALVDPFGLYVTGGKEERRVLDDEIPTLLHHRAATDASVSRQAGSTSATIHRVSRLRKLVATAILTPTPANASNEESSAVQQLLVDLVFASTVDFTILHDAGEVEEIMHVVAAALRRRPTLGSFGSLLGIVRVVLTRSLAWRKAIREDRHSLQLLLSFVFDTDARVRADAYVVVLALTCATDAILPSQDTTPQLRVPSEFAASFGLFSNRWSQSGVDVVSLSDMHQKSRVVIPDELLDEPAAHETERSYNHVEDDAVQRLWSGVNDAKSYRTYLDAVYTLIHACYADPSVSKHVAVAEKQAVLHRYLATTPTSAKDYVVMAATLALANATFDAMTRDDQMKIVLALRRCVIPLVLGSGHEPALSVQVIRLLQHMSKSSVADMFPSLILDSGLFKRLMDIAVSATPLQQSLWSGVVHAVTQARQPITQDAVLATLESIAARHRVPGSFQTRDLYVRAIASLATSAVKTGDSKSWQTRLIFDCTSTVRSVAFQARYSESEDPDSHQRLLRLAVDVMRDETESDVVRGAAAQFISRILQDKVEDRRSDVVGVLGGDRFIPQVLRDLLVRIQDRTKCSSRLDYASVQLLRQSVVWSDGVANEALGSARTLLTQARDDDFRRIALLSELLSLRNAFETYQRHSLTHIGLLVSEDAVWLMSVLPVALSGILETAKLFQALIDVSTPAVTSQVVQATPLLLQVVDCIVSVHESLQHHRECSPGLQQLHYMALDEATKLLALVLCQTQAVSAPDQLLDRFADVVTSLLDASAHPKRFHLSFSRIIAAILTRQSDALASKLLAHDRATTIAVSVWTAYRDLTDQIPMDPSLRSSPTSKAALLHHLRRNAFVLLTLCSRSQDAADGIASGRQHAVQHLVRCIKTTLAAIRLAGGLGAKNSNDSFAIEMLAYVQLHCTVLSGLCASSSTAQDLARNEQLPLMIATNWNALRLAQRRGCLVMVDALRMLVNYTHSNAASKASLASSVVSASTTQDGERSLLSMIGELALGASPNAATPADPRWAALASAILKSCLLHVECLHGALKTGLVSKLFARVVRLSRAKRQTTKPLPHDDQHALIELLGVLASVASSDEGRQVLLQLRELKNLVDDVLHFRIDSELLVAGALFLRNLAFSKFSKSHFAVWEPALEQIVSIVDRAANQDTRTALLVADHLSTALLSFVVDNQRAQSILTASHKTRALVDDAARAWDRVVHTQDSPHAHAVSLNLRRVQTLLEDPRDRNTQP